MKLVKWLATDTEKIFGKRGMFKEEDTLTNVKITALAHTQVADEYIGLCFEDNPVDGTEVIGIDEIPADTFYFIYNPSLGQWLNKDLVSLVIKELRDKALSESLVTLDDSTILNADEKSQERLNRAYTILGDTGETTWKDANNNFVKLTGSMIKQALDMAGANQSALWVEYNL